MTCAAPNSYLSLLQLNAESRRQLRAIIDDPDVTVANKVKAILDGNPNPASKKAQVRRVLIQAGLLPDQAILHVKNGELRASQISIADVDRQHFIAAVVGNSFILAKFDPNEARRNARSPHGSRSVSDALRANVQQCSTVVFEQPVTCTEGN